MRSSILWQLASLELQMYQSDASELKRRLFQPAVGGNHEAANHLWELHYGGWVAPNIYYLGAAGVVNFAGVRIAGLSGIFNGNHYKQVPDHTKPSIWKQMINPQ